MDKLQGFALVKQSLEAILENVGCGVCVTDIGAERVLFANKILMNAFERELKSNIFSGILKEESKVGQKEGRFELCSNDEECWYEVEFHEITWADGSLARMYSFLDVTEKRLCQYRAEQQTHKDFLTGLYNRICCERDLEAQITSAKLSGGQGAVLYLDLDDFKYINDGLGRQYGDVLLKAISNALQRINGIKSSCYRVGGDEFVIIVSHENYEGLNRILDDVQKVFAKPWFLKDTDYYCTMSMGIVCFPEAGDTVTELIKRAELAMYEAKKTGKNRMVTYSDSFSTASGRRLVLEKNMRDAAGDGCQEFEVYYQPIIDIRDSRLLCVGAEALVRWNSPQFGFVSPAEFIPLAEYLGLINPIGNYVLLEACTRCKKWNDNGYPEYKVNVNLSVVQLLQPDIVECIERAIQMTGILPGNLTLEVTESLAINDMERMKEILGNIKSLGVQLALDDFGTGYSSLNHIRELPIDVIKVDQSFVKDLAEDAYSQSFIKMVSELAETTGMSVCVEGIETPAQYKVLQGMKVKYIQGYYFDRPMPGSYFEEKYVAKKEETV